MAASSGPVPDDVAAQVVTFVTRSHGPLPASATTETLDDRVAVSCLDFWTSSRFGHPTGGGLPPALPSVAAVPGTSP